MAAQSRSGPHREMLNLRDAGDALVESDVVCVLTRFGLRRRRDMVAIRRDYRSVLAAIEGAGGLGLLRSALLFENAQSVFSLSIWRSRDAIPWFGTEIPEHVEAARRVFSRVKYKAGRGPEMWSTKWRLESVSNNLNWDTFDLSSEFSKISRRGE
jgi:hypothetical protein